MNTLRTPAAAEVRPPLDPLSDPRVVARLALSLPQTSYEEAWLAERFYGGLLAAHPGLKPKFSTDLATQTAKLVASVRVVLANVGRPAELHARLGALGRDHAARGARPEHYRIVSERLADALAELRGGDRELREQWFRALELVSAAMLAAA